MLRLLLLLFFAWPGSPAFFLGFFQGEATAEPTQVEIHSPQPGQVLQGSVPVIAVFPAEGVQAVEVSFSYAGDERETWFLIEEGSGPDSFAELAEWDTTVLSDGDYRLQVSVRMVEGDRTTVEVTGLRVRNYTPVETNTPTPPTEAMPAGGQESTLTPEAPAAILTATLQASAERLAAASPEPLPANPAQLTYTSVMASLGKGALAAGAAFLLLGAYRRLKQMIRKRSDSI